MRKLSLVCADIEGWGPSFFKPGDEILAVTGDPLLFQVDILHRVDMSDQLIDSLLERHQIAFKVHHVAIVNLVQIFNPLLKPINEEHEVTIPRCLTEVLFVRDKELIELILEVRVEEFLRFGRQTGNPLLGENLLNFRHDPLQVPIYF